MFCLEPTLLLTVLLEIDERLASALFVVKYRYSTTDMCKGAGDLPSAVCKRWTFRTVRTDHVTLYSCCVTCRTSA